MLDDDNSSPEVTIEEPPEVLETKECVDLTLDSDDNQAMEDEEQNDNEEPKGNNNIQNSSHGIKSNALVQYSGDLNYRQVSNVQK